MFTVLCASALLLTWLGTLGGWNETIRPYQLPVLLAGYLLPMNWAVACAVAVPVLGATVFGFPSALVMLPLVACQMIALAAFTNFLYTMLDMRPFSVFMLGTAFSFVILFCAAAIYGAVSHHAVSPLPYVRYTALATWPGLILQLAGVGVIQISQLARKSFHEQP